MLGRASDRAARYQPSTTVAPAAAAAVLTTPIPTDGTAASAAPALEPARGTDRGWLYASVLACLGLGGLAVPGLLRCRMAAALSQRELATKAGVSHVTIARLEGGHDAHPRTIRKLAEALGVQPAELMAQPPEAN